MSPAAIFDHNTGAAEIPEVDISEFYLNQNTHAERKDKARAVAEKCSQNGCLAIVGHGFPTNLLHEAFELQKKLFDLSAEDKMKAPHPPGLVPHRGYSSPGKERAFTKENAEMSDNDHKAILRATQDWKESYEVGHDGNREDYNIWLPDDVLPGFRPRSTEIFHALHDLSLRILEVLLLGLEFDDRERALVREHHSGVCGQLRFLHYLPLEIDKSVREEAERLPAHTDWSSFTLSFQDETGGLEFQDRTIGEFMPVRPRKDAVYLNVGDMMEKYSNGMYPACTHRVVFPPKSNLNGDVVKNSSSTEAIPERYSLIFFAMVNEDAPVEPPASRINRDGVAKFKPTTLRQHAAERMKWHYHDYQE